MNINNENTLEEYIPMIQKGLLKNRSLPHHPWYLERHPADQSRQKNSIVNQTTITISICNRMYDAFASYVSMVANTLRTRQANTMQNL